MISKFQHLIGITLILLVAVCGIIPPVQSDDSVLVNGTFYFRDITPKNDIYERTVMPGDTIVLGGTYDLTHVSGVSKAYAWWQNQQQEGLTCTPDRVIKTSYIDTNGKINPKNVTLSEENGWTAGRWWQWDGCFLRTTWKENGSGKPRTDYVPYIADNNLAFTLIKDPAPPTPAPTTILTPVITPEPTILENVSPIIIAPESTTTTGSENGDSRPWWYYPIIAIIGYVAYRILW